MNCKNINVKLHEGGRMPKQAEQGDWVDLYTSKTVRFWRPGKFKYIPLGVSMELPKGCEAILAPRSSTFKRWGLLQTNSIGVFDEAFRGDGDQWLFPARSTRWFTKIPKGTRLCQFRIVEHQPALSFTQVESLGNPDRGGWGSTGA